MDDLEKLYDWLMDENRKLAQTYFTAGMARNIAKEIEYRLSISTSAADKGGAIADKEKERLYWQQRCEAAENILSCVPLPENVGFRNLYLPGFVEAVEKYQQLKNQSTKEKI